MKNKLTQLFSNSEQRFIITNNGIITIWFNLMMIPDPAITFVQVIFFLNVLIFQDIGRLGKLWENYKQLKPYIQWQCLISYLSDQVWIIYQYLQFSQQISFNSGFTTKVTCGLQENIYIYYYQIWTPLTISSAILILKYRS